jgi:hypothetical protein
MKTIKILTTILISGLAFSACKKDDKPQTTLEKLQAKWTLNKQINHFVYLGNQQYDTTSTAGDYIDFRTDGKAYSKVAGTLDTSAYSLLTDTRLITNSGSANDTLDIQTLTLNALQLHYKTNMATGYYESTFYLSK